MRDYYAKRAVEYEEVYEKPERQGNLEKIRSFLSGAFLQRDLLEVACGTGYWTQFIAKASKSVLATDANLEVIDIARTKDYGRCRVQFVQSDAYSLAEVVSRHNAAFCGFWWSHIPVQRLAGFLRGLHSKLDSGSKVVMIDNLFVPGSSTAISKSDEVGNTYQMRRLRDGSFREVLKNFPSEDFLRKHLNEMGRHVTLSILDYYWIAEYQVI